MREKISPLEAARRFAFAGAVEDASPYGNGRIHDTFRVSCAGGAHYILQRLSRSLPTDPVVLIENGCRIVAHLKSKEEDPRRRLSCVDAADGKGYWRDSAGDHWRASDFIEGTATLDVVETPEQAYEAAKAFGAFLGRLDDLPARDFAPVLPHFHDTPKRFLQLESALAADAHGRASGAEAEVEFALSRKEMAGVLVSFQERGEMIERVVHNDTKVNNVLFDAGTGEGLCVVDLDTVMPGLILYDFGDLVRSAVSDTDEDERDLERIAVRMPVFEALARGFLDGMRGELNRCERDHMAFSAKLIAYELGMRFLTDHLNGDPYFKISREGQNLDRCRAQFALARDIERKEEVMSRLVEQF